MAAVKGRIAMAVGTAKGDVCADLYRKLAGSMLEPVSSGKMSSKMRLVEALRTGG